MIVLKEHTNGRSQCTAILWTRQDTGLTEQQGQKPRFLAGIQVTNHASRLQ